MYTAEDYISSVLVSTILATACTQWLDAMIGQPNSLDKSHHQLPYNVTC